MGAFHQHAQPGDACGRSFALVTPYYIAQVEDTNLDFFLFAADTPAEIIDAYTNLTGKSPLLPVWSYGLWMARAYYRTADELLDVVKEMRARQIPLDVILLDGRAWHKPETRFDFSWDPDRYPDPLGFVKQLDEHQCAPVPVGISVYFHIQPAF